MSLIVRKQSEFAKQRIALAKRRVILKRFLSRMGIPFRVDDSTEFLMSLVKNAHRNRIGKPYMTNEEMESLASENHLANNLLSMKQMWGINTGIGILDFDGKTKRYNTFREMYQDGHIPKKFVVLDQHLPNLKFL